MKKKIVWFFVILSVLLGIVLLLLDQSYAYSKPREPHPGVGQVYAHVAGFDPKRTVYLTSNELLAFYLLMGTSIVSACIVGALNATWKVFRN